MITTLSQATYLELLERARPHLRYDPDQPRDEQGRFGEGGGGGGGGGLADDPFVGEIDEGDHGYGRDPNGDSYTEYDVDTETGEPKFSESYRDKYGPLTSDSTLETREGRTFAMATSEKGPYLHVADDSNGTKEREVIQEFSRKESVEAGAVIWSVYNGDRPEATTSSGITVRPAGANPTQDGVVVTWSNGREDTFQGESGDDTAFELQEGFMILGASIRSATFGTVIVHPDPLVRDLAAQFLHGLPSLPHLRYDPDQPRDEAGRFGEGSGGGVSGDAALAAVPLAVVETKVDLLGKASSKPGPGMTKEEARSLSAYRHSGFVKINGSLRKNEGEIPAGTMGDHMVSRPPPQCLSCVHWVSPLVLDDENSHRPDPVQVCAAYPDGIPDKIWWNVVDHRQPYEGDHDIRWESRKGASFPVWALEE